jgi:PPOX class probable F420-dependent enzyme
MSSTPWTATSSNAMTDEEISRFLADPRIARLATSGHDGSIHLTPVWFLHEDGRFYLTLGQRRRQLRNLRRDPRATLLIDVDRRPDDGPGGEVRAVMCRGIVEISADQTKVEAISDRIDRRYLASAEPDAEIVSSSETYELVTLTPTTVLSWDFSKS